MPNFTVAANNNTGNSDVKMVFDYSYDSSTFRLLGVKLTGFTGVSYLYPWFPCKNNGSTTPETFIQLNTVEIKGKIMGIGTFRWDDSDSYAYAQGGGGGSTDQIQNVVIPVINNQINITIDCYLFSTNSQAGGYNRKYFDNVTATINLTDDTVLYDGSFAQKDMIIYSINSNANYSNIKNFNELRKAVQIFLNNVNRQTSINDNDKSGLQLYQYSGTNSGITNYNSTITQRQDDKINASIAGAINIIRDFIKNNYMTLPSSLSQTVINNIKNQEEITNTSYTIIPALKNYFTIINYWNQGTDSDTRCNGVCTGFCSGACVGQNSGVGSGCGNSGCSGGSDYGYGTTFCSSCNNHCISSCTDCTDACDSQCAETCYQACQGYCEDVCKNGCRTACTGTCANGSLIGPDIA